MSTGYHHHASETRRTPANGGGTSAYGYGGGASAGQASSHVAASAVSSSRKTGVSQQQLQRFDVLLRRPENRECFECGAKQPRWASTNLGVFFCLRCAGIHRSMGTHISKVKSTNMDAWEESMIQVMEHIGNTRGRLLYEYNMPHTARVTAATETSLVERALRAKYEKKAYYHPQFDELYAQFMGTPIEGVASPTGGPAPADVGTLPPPPGANAPPRRQPQGTQQQPPPQQQQQQQRPQQPAQQASALEELWGAPVTSPTTGQPEAHRVAHTNVAELFAGSYPAGVGAGPMQPSAAAANSNPWGPAMTNTGGNATGYGSSASPYVSPTSGGGSVHSGWFDSNFGGSNGNPHGSNTPSPHSPQTGQPSRSNTDDLFQNAAGSNNGTPGRGAGSSKDEILSLFSSAPLAGGGGQSSASQAHGSPSGAHPTAWQPQVVRPYYSPDR